MQLLRHLLQSPQGASVEELCWELGITHNTTECMPRGGQVCRCRFRIGNAIPASG